MPHQASFCQALSIVGAVALLLASPPTWADPRADYFLHCGGCHLPNGAGHPPEVPTLRQLGQIARTAQGRDYLVRVPGASQAQVSDARLAAIINWVLREFNADSLDSDFQPLDAAEVGRSRKHILADPLGYREEIWPDY